MKLQQLRYVWEVAHHNLNVSTTAQSLYTSQPGISKQIRLLEDELGVEIFTRNGKHFTQITSAGEKIIEKAGEVLRLIESIKQVSQEFYSHNKGTLSIAATYVHASFKIPAILTSFTQEYPDVVLHMYQGNAEQVTDMVVNSTVDLAITGDHIVPSLHNELLMIPCYRWKYCIVVPKNHPLTQLSQEISLDILNKYPIVTYVHNGSGRVLIDDVFSQAGYHPRIVFTATDTNVIKNYIQNGLGVGIIAAMTYDKVKDTNLTAIDISHIIPAVTAHICVRPGNFLRAFMSDFIHLCANFLSKNKIETLLNCHNQNEINKIFIGVQLPEY